jgi:hypothetical protein
MRVHRLGVDTGAMMPFAHGMGTTMNATTI